MLYITRKSTAVIFSIILSASFNTIALSQEVRSDLDFGNSATENIQPQKKTLVNGGQFINYFSC